MDNQRIETLRECILAGGEVSREEALELALESDSEALFNAAEEITRRMVPRHFDSCSIVNIRSGLCPEDCKWCAQSVHNHTGCDTYPMLEKEKAAAAAMAAEHAGIGRFSLVASGRSVRGEALDRVIDCIHHIRSKSQIYICASLGLLDRGQLEKLRDAGVRRYHCNLETAPSYFGELCTTHTTADKLATLRAARDLGFEVCSGGIIGMGESMAQRVELALTLREVEPVSIPLNLLHPIPGTPLESAAPLSDDEILRTVAVFRFIHPRVQIRFAGGRALMSEAVQQRALRIGINGGIVGDLLTTVGSGVEEDKERVTRAGYEF